MLAALVALAVAVLVWKQFDAPHYLEEDPARFATRFEPPPEPNSAEAAEEIEELLEIQEARTPSDEVAAQADRKTRIERFYGALGLDAGQPPDLSKVERLAGRVEDDVRIQVRAVKDHYRRLRPYVVESRLKPCIDDVKDDLSYPSGHAAFAWSMASLLEIMVPEKRDAIRARAAEFARQRMVCGVHFASDIEAGRIAGIELVRRMEESEAFRDDLTAAGQELRQKLGLGAIPFLNARAAPASTVDLVTELIDARDQAFRDRDIAGVCAALADRFEYRERVIDKRHAEPETAEELEALQSDGSGDSMTLQTREQFCRPPDPVLDRKFDAHRRRLRLDVTMKPGSEAIRYVAEYVLVSPAPGDDLHYYTRLSESGDIRLTDDQPSIESASAHLEEWRYAREDVPAPDRPDAD